LVFPFRGRFYFFIVFALPWCPVTFFEIVSSSLFEPPFPSRQVVPLVSGLFLVMLSNPRFPRLPLRPYLSVFDFGRLFCSDFLRRLFFTSLVVLPYLPSPKKKLSTFLLFSKGPVAFVKRTVEKLPGVLCHLKLLTHLDLFFSHTMDLWTSLLNPLSSGFEDPSFSECGALIHFFPLDLRCSLRGPSPFCRA